ncbi:M23 family metallopeptidase [Kordiimonas pumila]|uniref:M23 family metallopeptidase n=1 Tax=Kordiimonas pumila TaxID=2161677 RepID=A0ABV7D6R4_9PROT|nr:M23 family metallopeptidase [Kordiimonas pumila]
MKALETAFLLLFTVTCAAYAVAATELQGSVAQGGMVWGIAEQGAVILLDGNPVKVGPEGQFVFGFGRDAGPEARLIIISRAGKRTEKILKVEQRTFDIERVKGLPPKTVNPPPEWAAQRKVETGRVAKARAETTGDTFWTEGFIRPAKGRFSGFYGSQRILNGEPKNPHYGLDIAAKVGEPIYAPAGGTVRLADPGFLLEGGIVIIDHGYGVTSTLFHMNSVDVKEGETLHQGDPIGTIGATGRASGPHVDWRVNWGSVRLDPYLLLSEADKK